MSNPDYTKVLSESEIETLKVYFRTMPTYSAEDGEYIASTDLPKLVKKMGFERTDEQVAGYVGYWNKLYGGKVPLGKYLELATDVYDVAKTSRHAAAAYDKNGDGIIEADEFQEFLDIMVLHDPKLKLLDFSEFVKEADTNNDGEVSIDEFANWIAKHVTLNKS